MSRLVLVLTLASRLAWGADSPDAGAPLAVAVQSATLRPLASPDVPVEVGVGVYLPEALAVQVASSTPAPAPTSAVVWLVVGALVLGVGGGFALGWTARPTAAP